MFAVFTKIAWLILQPSSLIVIAMGVGMWHLFRQRIAEARRWLAASIATLVVLLSSARRRMVAIRVRYRVIAAMCDRFPSATIFVNSSTATTYTPGC